MDDRSLFAIYFAGLASIRLHPRNADIIITEKANVPLLPEEIEVCAFYAKQMVDITNEFFPSED
jgi:hypothetical protein